MGGKSTPKKYYLIENNVKYMYLNLNQVPNYNGNERRQIQLEDHLNRRGRRPNNIKEGKQGQ